MPSPSSSAKRVVLMFTLNTSFFTCCVRRHHMLRHSRDDSQFFGCGCSSACSLRCVVIFLCHFTAKEPQTKIVGSNTQCACNNYDCPMAVVGLVHRFCVLVPCCSCVFVVCGRMCVDRLSLCPDPDFCLGCDTFRRDGVIRVPCELVVTVSSRVSQQCNSVRVFLCFDFFGRVKTALPVRVLHHTGIVDLVCTRFTRVWLSLTGQVVRIAVRALFKHDWFHLSSCVAMRRVYVVHAYLVLRSVGTRVAVRRVQIVHACLVSFLRFCHVYSSFLMWHVVVGFISCLFWTLVADRRVIVF